MAGGTNQMKPRGTGMPEGFTSKGGAAQQALQDYYNPTTGQTYTHPNLGANPGEGWMAGKPPPGQEYAQWQDPNAPPRQPGLKGGGGFGGWNPGQGQPGQFPDMNIAGRQQGLPGGGQQPRQFNMRDWQQGLLDGGQNVVGGSGFAGINSPGFPGYANLPKNWA